MYTSCQGTGADLHEQAEITCLRVNMTFGRGSGRSAVSTPQLMGVHSVVVKGKVTLQPKPGTVYDPLGQVAEDARPRQIVPTRLSRVPESRWETTSPLRSLNWLALNLNRSRWNSPLAR